MAVAAHLRRWTQLPQPPPPAAPGAAVGGSNALADAAAAAAPPWPCERMCHSLTGLSDGRLLVVGGRNKEGICRDMWLLDAVRKHRQGCWQLLVVVLCFV